MNIQQYRGLQYSGAYRKSNFHLPLLTPPLLPLPSIPSLLLPLKPSHLLRSGVLGVNYGQIWDFFIAV